MGIIPTMNMMASNRQRLLAAAKALFLEQGYGASVDAITGRAGVARQTFYNHFQSKEGLFAEVARDCFLDIVAPLEGHPEELRKALVNFVQVYRQRVLSPDGISSYRMLSGQAQHFPALAQEAYNIGAGQIIERLSGFLRAAIKKNHLRHADDPAFMAEMLMAMAVGLERTQLLFGIHPQMKDEQEKVEHIVDGFLRMFVQQPGK